MKQNKDTFNVYEVLGVKPKKANEIEKFMEHCKIESSDLHDLAVKLDIVNGGEFALKIFLWAWEVKTKQDQMKAEQIMDVLGFGDDEN